MCSGRVHFLLFVALALKARAASVNHLLVLWINKRYFEVTAELLTEALTGVLTNRSMIF